MNMQNPLIRVQNLHVTLNERKILEDVNFDLYDRDSLVVLGGSGTGKSVLLKSILGLLPIESGQIFIQGTDILKASSKVKQELLGSIGMLFQGSALFDSMPVWENVAFSLLYGRRMKKDQAYKIAVKKLALVDLSEKTAELYPASLSGGMQKRVGLARALATNPKIIFFDEPTTGLDPITSRTVNQLIDKTLKDTGIGAITITHDLQCLHYIAKRVIFLAEKKIAWSGSIEEFNTTSNPYVCQFLEAGGYRAVL